MASETALFSPPGVEEIPLEPDKLDRASDLLRKLAQVCDWRSAAVKARRAGDTEGARYNDEYADRLYRQLPGWTKAQRA